MVYISVLQLSTLLLSTVILLKKIIKICTTTRNWDASGSASMFNARLTYLWRLDWQPQRILDGRLREVGVLQHEIHLILLGLVRPRER